MSLNVHDQRIRTAFGYYNGDIQVSTVYLENRYETAIKHPKYSKEVWTVVQEHENNKVTAEKEHNMWVKAILEKTLPDISLLPIKTSNILVKPPPTFFKITLMALIRILRPISNAENPCRITKTLEDGKLAFAIPLGDHQGSLIYSTKDQMAYSVSPSWAKLIMGKIR